MGNEAHLLDPRVAAAAAAIANARGGRRGAPEIANILDILPRKLFDEVVEDAEAAIQAATAADGAPPAPRARGPLNAADASLVGLSLDAGTLVILARDRASRPTAAVWAAGVGASVVDEHEAGQLWSAFVAVSRKLAETSA
ncbi:hypothetical protein ACFZ8E_11565 [Methylobacterium sp. HMF5984]|uniref:hypothetical protein n=1 Tax=Methylobacterium sp. HMF5984 TaxID=3367370 RepID=UPI003851F34A